MKETGKFDVVLLEKSGDHGITCSNVIDIRDFGDNPGACPWAEAAIRKTER